MEKKEIYKIAAFVAIGVVFSGFIWLAIYSCRKKRNADHKREADRVLGAV